MKTVGHLDCVIRVNVNSFLLRGWCSDCRPESCLKIELQNDADIVARLNSQYGRIARPDVIAAVDLDQAMLHCGFLIEVQLPPEVFPTFVHLSDQLVPWPVPDESDYALRQSLLNLCHASSWVPQVLGATSAAIGLEEALEEIVSIRQREAYALADDLVCCCREQGFSHPLLDDNEAWIAYEACEFERAESIWRALASSKVEGISDQAKATLNQLFINPSVDVQLADIARMRARQLPDILWRERLLHVWLCADDSKDQKQVFDALKDNSLDLGIYSENLCDPELLAMTLLASLCEERLRNLSLNE